MILRSALVTAGALLLVVAGAALGVASTTVHPVSPPAGASSACTVPVLPPPVRSSETANRGFQFGNREPGEVRP